MKRDKLYTINKGNKNLFAYAGSLNSIAAADKSNNPWDYADDLSTTAQFLGTSRGQAYANTKNALGITKAQNPFSQINIGSTLTAAAPAVGGMVGGLIGGGYSSGAGNLMSGLGKAASAIPGPWGAGISAGLQIAGGAVNGLFGEKVDQENLQETMREHRILITSQAMLLPLTLFKVLRHNLLFRMLIREVYSIRVLKERMLLLEQIGLQHRVMPLLK